MAEKPGRLRLTKKERRKLRRRKLRKEAVRTAAKAVDEQLAKYEEDNLSLYAARGSVKTIKNLYNIFRGIRKVVLKVLAFLHSTAALVLGMILLIVVILTLSCTLFVFGLGAIAQAAATWPAEEEEITQAESYYTKLEAQLQADVNAVPGNYAADEYDYQVCEIEHDAVMLISYLCARYEDFTFRNLATNQVKTELDTLFDLHYTFSATMEEETRYKTVFKTVTVTETVYEENPQTGETEAKVLTSVYTYTEEEAYTWYICHVVVTSADFETLLLGRLTDDQQELYGLYLEAKGNRVIYENPLGYGWNYFITGNYGWRCGDNETSISADTDLQITAPAGTAVYAVLNGTITSTTTSKVVLSDESGGVVTLSGLNNITVSKGDAVSAGDQIATIGSGGTLTIAFSYNGTTLNPVFYLETGTTYTYSAYGSSITSDYASLLAYLGDLEDLGENAALLITEAVKYIGVPYVWGGYSPSGLDCSGFVSYAINHCGAGWSIGHCTTGTLVQLCTWISTSITDTENVKPGDLLFLKNTYDSGYAYGVSHVGIYLGNGQYIHASSSAGQVTISTISSYTTSHFLCWARLPNP